MARQIAANDDVETGETIRVSYDENTVKGTVSEIKHDGDKIVIEGDDGEVYVLYKPMVTPLGFDFDKGGAIDGASATRLSDDPDSVEIL